MWRVGIQGSRYATGVGDGVHQLAALFDQDGGGILVICAFRRANCRVWVSVAPLGSQPLSAFCQNRDLVEAFSMAIRCSETAVIKR